MLKQRIYTALVMLAVLLPALFYPDSLPFSLIAMAIVVTAAWEWGRLNGVSFGASVGLGAVCLVACLAIWYAGLLGQRLQSFWMLAGATWVLGSVLLLRSGPEGWTRVPQLIRLTIGVFALCTAWIALVQAKNMGANFILSVMLLVWVADIGAYFSGRALGLRFTKRKLAPSLSPGKSWEGVWGGLLGAMIMGALWVFFDQLVNASAPSLYTVLAQRSVLLLPIAIVFMVSMSVAGDLVESLMKRSANAKDSSGLLPGHGGVLDRIDALLPTLPIALMLTRLALL